MEIRMDDEILLKDGRKGYVVEIFSPEVFLVDISLDDGGIASMVNVRIEDIERILSGFGEKIEGQPESDKTMPADIRESDEVLLKNGERGYIREIYSADFFLLDRIDELTDELDSTFTVRLADIDRILSRFEERCPYLAKLAENPDLLDNEKSKGQSYPECAFSVKIRPIYHYGDVEQEKNPEKQ